MFWQVIEWKIGSKNDFKVSVGKSGKFAQKFINESLYEDILKTYSDSNIENNWYELDIMSKTFINEQKKLAEKLNFEINLEEATNSIEYLRKIRIE